MRSALFFAPTRIKTFCWQQEILSLASISTLKESWLITEFYLFMKSSRGAIKGKLRIISEKSWALSGCEIVSQRKRVPWSFLTGMDKNPIESNGIQHSSQSFRNYSLSLLKSYSLRCRVLPMVLKSLGKDCNSEFTRNNSQDYFILE